DVIATGSTWCSSVLRDHGFPQVATVLQGIDPLTFNPSFAGKELFHDSFVIFSGGKLEYRKGQDIVIRAFQVLQDKYPDVMLVNSWHNPWDVNLRSLADSPHIRLPFTQ